MPKLLSELRIAADDATKCTSSAAQGSAASLQGNLLSQTAAAAETIPASSTPLSSSVPNRQKLSAKSGTPKSPSHHGTPASFWMFLALKRAVICCQLTIGIEKLTIFLVLSG